MSVPVGPILLAAAAIASLGIARHYPLWSDGGLGSGLMPTVGAGLILLCSLAQLPVRAGVPGEDQNARKVARYLVALVVLPLGVVALGMLPALALFALAVLVLVERMAATHSMLIAVGSLAFNWLVFQRLLQVALPQSAFW